MAKTQSKGEMVKAEHVTITDFLTNPSRFGTLETSFGSKTRAEAALNIFLSAIGPNQKLRECTPRSLYSCMERAAQLKLTICGALGESWAIPFKKEATFILGYQGMRTLGLRHPDVGAIDSLIVYQGDEFDVEYGSKMDIKHRPWWIVGNEQGSPIRAYTIVRLNNGMVQFLVMSKEEIYERRDRSPSWRNHKKYGSDTPWTTDEMPMWMKTTIRAIFSQIPKSIEMIQALSLDTDDPTYESVGVEPRSQASALADQLGDGSDPELDPKVTKDPEPTKDPKGTETQEVQQSPDPETVDESKTPPEHTMPVDAPDDDPEGDAAPTLDLADDNEGRGAAIEMIQKMLEHLSKADWNQIRIAFQKHENVRSWKTASIKQLEILYNIVREKMVQRGVDPETL